jgi:hypothetical protein
MTRGKDSEFARQCTPSMKRPKAPAMKAFLAATLSPLAYLFVVAAGGLLSIALVANSGRVAALGCLCCATGACLIQACRP